MEVRRVKTGILKSPATRYCIEIKMRRIVGVIVREHIDGFLFQEATLVEPWI